MEKVVFVVGYLLCSVLAWGTTAAYFKGEFPRIRSRSNVGIAVFMALMGPVGAVASMFLSGFYEYGWSLWPADTGNEWKD